MAEIEHVTRTYHPLAGEEAATERHPGMLTRCLHPACMTAAANLVPDAEHGEHVERLRRESIEDLHEEMCPCGYSASGCHGRNDFADYAALVDAACGPLRAEVARLRAELAEACDERREISREESLRAAETKDAEREIERLETSVGKFEEFYREVRDLQATAADRGRSSHLKAQEVGGEERVGLLYQGYEAFDFNLMFKELFARYADIAPVELTDDDARAALEDAREEGQDA